MSPDQIYDGVKEGFGLYTYCRNNPLVYHDPSGLVIIEGAKEDIERFIKIVGQFYAKERINKTDIGKNKYSITVTNEKNSKNNKKEQGQVTDLETIINPSINIKLENVERKFAEHDQSKRGKKAKFTKIDINKIDSVESDNEELMSKKDVFVHKMAEAYHMQKDKKVKSYQERFNISHNKAMDDQNKWRRENGLPEIKDQNGSYPAYKIKFIDGREILWNLRFR